MPRQTTCGAGLIAPFDNKNVGIRRRTSSSCASLVGPVAIRTSLAAEPVLEIFDLPERFTLFRRPCVLFQVDSQSIVVSHSAASCPIRRSG